MNLHEVFSRYLEHLDSGNPRLKLIAPPYDPTRSAGYVAAGSLTMCPLKYAQKKNGVPQTVTIDQSIRLPSQYVMQIGSFIGELMAEAAVFHYGGNARAEVEVCGQGIFGYTDIVIDDNGLHVVEVKSGTPYGQYKVPQPKLSHVLQVIAYAEIIGGDTATIVLFNRYGEKAESPFVLWNVERYNQGWTVTDENGERWDSDHNDPAILCMEYIQTLVARHQSYLNGCKQSPYPDFLNNREAWECSVTVRKPSTYKTVANAKRSHPDSDPVEMPDGSIVVPGEIRPRCEWFCHGTSEQYETLLENGRIVKAWEETMF